MPVSPMPQIQNSYVAALTPNVMVSGGLREVIGVGELMRVGHRVGFMLSYADRDPRASSLGHGEKPGSASQKHGPPQNSPLPVP